MARTMDSPSPAPSLPPVRPLPRQKGSNRRSAVLRIDDRSGVTDAQMSVAAQAYRHLTIGPVVAHRVVEQVAGELGEQCRVTQNRAGCEVVGDFRSAGGCCGAASRSTSRMSVSNGTGSLRRAPCSP